MKSKWIDQTITYDGSQLRSLFAYLQYEVAGDSVIAWRGPCNITSEKMVDGEDLLLKAKICGSDMLHFIVEIFHQDLITAVAVQRLLASQARDLLLQMTNISPKELTRDGDDIFWQDKKLSISIAAKSPNSSMIHFAVNVDNAGTPVKTCALNDFGIKPAEFGQNLVAIFEKEYASIEFATVKVRPLP